MEPSSAPALPLGTEASCAGRLCSRCQGSRGSSRRFVVANVASKFSSSLPSPHPEIVERDVCRPRCLHHVVGVEKGRGTSRRGNRYDSIISGTPLLLPSKSRLGRWKLQVRSVWGSVVAGMEVRCFSGGSRASHGNVSLLRPPTDAPVNSRNAAVAHR